MDKNGHFLFCVTTALLLFGLLAFRVNTLARVPENYQDLSATKAAVAHWLEQAATSGSRNLPDSLTELGVDGLRMEQFDPTAVVYLQPGPDGQPGVAGVDDNGDAQIDNRVELGATGSDDVCLVAAADNPGLNHPNTLILQRGAFLPKPGDPGKTPDRDQASGEQRVIVTGQTNQDAWSFLIEID